VPLAENLGRNYTFMQPSDLEYVMVRGFPLSVEASFIPVLIFVSSKISGIPKSGIHHEV
jgi:hypothetical protein